MSACNSWRKQSPTAYMIWVEPASRLFSNISFRALAGLCGRDRGDNAAARRSGGGAAPAICRAAVVGALARPHPTCLDDFAGRDAVHHSLIQAVDAWLRRRCIAHSAGDLWFSKGEALDPQRHQKWPRSLPDPALQTGAYPKRLPSQ
jgi:hypothetical protein